MIPHTQLVMNKGNIIMLSPNSESHLNKCQDYLYVKFLVDL